MGKRGPKPSPTAVKEARGDRRINANEPSLDPSIPDCPGHLGGEAVAEWNRLAPMLCESGILTDADRAVFSIYCETWGQYVKRSLDVQKHGSVATSAKGVIYDSPYYNQMLSSMKLLKTIAAEIGVTPSSRNGIAVVKASRLSDAEQSLRVVGL